MTRSADAADEIDADGRLRAAIVALAALTRRLRHECPWDREQTLSTIVQHTVEEAYETADAARAADAEPTGENLSALAGELGDLLFQVVLLAEIAGEQPATQLELADVIQGIHDKLVHRHPHIFAAAQAESADDVRKVWENVKGSAEGERIFRDVPQSLPGVLGALKVQARAAAVGFDFPSAHQALDQLESEVAELRAALGHAERAGTLPHGESSPADQRVEQELGDVLFAAVNVARLAHCDPENAVRGCTARFVERVRLADRLAALSGKDFVSLDLDAQETWYQNAKQDLATP